jgi:hypothetical protein
MAYFSKGRSGTRSSESGNVRFRLGPSATSKKARNALSQIQPDSKKKR